MNEKKIMFSAEVKISEDKKGVYLKDIRTRRGEIIKKEMIPFFSFEDKEEISHLESGEYISFLANVEFKDIEIFLA